MPYEKGLLYQEARDFHALEAKTTIHNLVEKNSDWRKLISQIQADSPMIDEVDLKIQALVGAFNDIISSRLGDNPEVEPIQLPQHAPELQDVDIPVILKRYLGDYIQRSYLLLDAAYDIDNQLSLEPILASVSEQLEEIEKEASPDKAAVVEGTRMAYIQAACSFYHQIARLEGKVDSFVEALTTAFPSKDKLLEAFFGLNSLEKMYHLAPLDCEEGAFKVDLAFFEQRGRFRKQLVEGLFPD